MPELLHKLRILADAAKYDASCASSGSNRSTPAGGIGNGASVGICHSYTPDGRCVSLLKLLLTIAPLLRDAAPWVRGMAQRSASAGLVPSGADLPLLAQAARACTACELCGPATQTVFGEGPAEARAMLVGEQPGDQEDLAGRPFIGPAGQVLGDALRIAGLERSRIYLTNAVKHFKFEPRGKIRLHQRPSAREAAACRGWLEAELAVVKPRAVLCLGATAAQSLLGARFSLTRNLGRVQTAPFAPWVLATYHPSAVLRADPAAREQVFTQLVRDLRACAEASR